MENENQSTIEIVDSLASENGVVQSQKVAQTEQAPIGKAIVETPREGFTPKFNWGGVSLTFLFAIANRAYLGLLILISVIPIVGQIFMIVWMVISGLNIEKWTLSNPKNQYRDNEEFRQVMDSWNRAGFISFIIEAAVVVIYLVVLIFVGLMSMMIPSY